MMYVKKFFVRLEPIAGILVGIAVVGTLALNSLKFVSMIWPVTTILFICMGTVSACANWKTAILALVGLAAYVIAWIVRLPHALLANWLAAIGIGFWFWGFLPKPIEGVREIAERVRDAR